METSPNIQGEEMGQEDTLSISVLSGLPEGCPQGSLTVKVPRTASARDLLRMVCTKAQVPMLPSYGLQTIDGAVISLDTDLVQLHCVQKKEILMWITTDHGASNKCCNAFWFMGIISLLIAIGGLVTIICLYTYEEDKVQYAVIFDAGSTHTSMYIYKWEGEKINCTAVAIQDGAKCKVHGRGISSYANNTAGAGKSLVDCLNSATDRIPSDKHGATPIYMGATAGMRLLRKQNPKASDEVLESVRSTIGGYPFKFGEPERQARIINGSDEGAFSWITSNYITGTFDVHPPTDGVVPKLIVSSVGTLDLGGASTQITFIPNRTRGMPEKEHFLTDLYGTNYSLYTHSYLCYGVNEATRRLQAVLVEVANFTTNVSSPCSPKGLVVNITHGQLFNSPCISGEDAVLNYGRAIVTPDHIDQEVVYYLHGESNATECRALVTDFLFNLSAPCPYNGSCSFNGVFQPPVFGDFYGISSYYYMMEFLNLTESDTVNYTDFSTASQSLCAKDWQEVKQMKTGAPQNLPWYCFESIYIDTILVDGYGFDPNSTWKGIHFVKSISGVDAGWTLGFIINESNQLPTSPVDRMISTVLFAFLVCLFICFFFLCFCFFRIARRHWKSPNRSFYTKRQGYGTLL
ncbi:ectonucleoside triphosphate diphosphohydrolase 8-like [Babylonia areolata]|uniref:ectonucleoside triphosphate diphosphohydrolase 8-like n=1 Tax=Babylonia areolata TaxID=304850 RepID=UPI003FCF295E